MSDDERPVQEGRSPLLQRWSRRKQRSRAEPCVDDQTDNQADKQACAPEPVLSAAEDTAEIELPRIEDLDENSDYSAFFNPKVAEDLRRVALRKLFRSAVFNVRDGLDDYDEDFTVYEPLGDIVTADMRHEMRRKAERAKEQLAESGGPEESGSGEETTAAAEDTDQPAPEVDAQRVDSRESGQDVTQTTLADTESEPDAGLPNPCKPAS